MSSSSRNRTRFHSVRLTPGELALLRGRARPAGVPLATYFRQCALAHRIRSRGNCFSRPDIDELVRLGRQLNTFARAANTARRIVSEPALGELLAEIREYARELLAKVRSSPLAVPPALRPPWRPLFTRTSRSRPCLLRPPSAPS